MVSTPKTPLEALQALVAKLLIVEADSNYKAVWALVAAHGFHYDGPDWERELAQAKEILTEWEEDTTVQ